MKRNLFLLLISIPLIFSSCKSEDDDSKKSFVVSYISRVGTAPSPIFLEENTILSTTHLPDLTVENYVFEGWEYDGKKLQAGSKKVTQNMILTAIWKGNDCAVTFTHSDNVSGQTFTRIYESGEEISLPQNPYGEKPGLEFKGWLNSKIYYKENATFKVTQDTIFTACYVEQGEHTISYYDVQDGVLVSDTQKFADSTSLTGQDNPLTFTESENIFISDLQKTGYTFGGFYTSKNCEPDEEATTFWLASTVKNDVTLYAKWTTNSYTINFDGNAGSLKAGKTQDSIEDKSYEQTITLPECNYELSGYEFLAWSIKAEEYDTEFEAGETVLVKDICSQTDDDQITLYAHWKDSENPAAPTDFTVDSLDSSSISLSWKNTTDSDLAYTRLSYYSKSSSVRTFIDFVAENYLPGEECSYTVENLVRGETYYFTITSYDVTGNSNDWVSACNLTAVPRPAPYSPTLSFSQNSPTELVVKWDKPSPDDYPYIEKITLFVDDTEISSYTSQDSTGDCYDKNTLSCTVNPLTVYKVQLKLTEKLDDSGRNNPSESAEYTYFSEPDFNVTLKEPQDKPKYYRYSNALGFDLEEPENDSSNNPISSLGITSRIMAECTQLDSNGNKIERTKSVSEIAAKNANGVYLRNELESNADYFVRLYLEVKKTIGEETYTSYAYSLSENPSLQKCTTASAHQAEVGYFCYSGNEFYYDIQPETSKTPCGIVTSINGFGQAAKVIALTDLTSQVRNLSEADTAVSALTDGNLIWSVPASEDILEIFDSQKLEKILTSLEKAGGIWFTVSTIAPDGSSSGRYLTQTAGNGGTICVHNIADRNCSQPIEVNTESGNNTYSVRPFAKLQN